MGYEDSSIDFSCPVCKQRISIKLHQLFSEELIVCTGCGAMSSGGQLSEINQAFKKLEIEILNIQGMLDKQDYSRETTG
ncbi:hypothetical protein ACFLU9_02885 [Chloroflexota bacterium]